MPPWRRGCYFLIRKVCYMEYKKIIKLLYVHGFLRPGHGGSGHPPWGRYPCLVKCTQSHARAERKLQAGDHMTAAVGGNPCKRLQATLAPCGSLSQISGGSPRGYVRTTRRGKRQKAPSRLDHQRWKGLLKRKSDREKKKSVEICFEKHIATLDFLLASPRGFEPLSTA